MKEKMTVDQFNAILVDLEQMKDSPAAHMGVRLVAGNDLDLDYLSEIPSYMKASLCRKVLRYVAKTALKGTMEIDGLASSCGFCAMENGHAVSFGSLTEWSFYSRRLNKTITVEINQDKDSFSARIVRFYDKERSLLMEVEPWTGCHWTQVTGRIDLMGYFDDTRNPLL
jgi:hypothetical protein